MDEQLFSPFKLALQIVSNCSCIYSRKVGKDEVANVFENSSPRVSTCVLIYSGVSLHIIERRFGNVTYLLDILFPKQNLVVLVFLELSDKGPYKSVIVFCPGDIRELGFRDLWWHT